MQDIIEVVKNASEDSPRARKEALLPLADNAGIARLFHHLLAGQDARAVLRGLCDLCTEKATREIVAHYAKIHEAGFTALLFSEDAQIRKNTALLLGRLDAQGYASLLLRALFSEQTDFVKPSIILALGNAKGMDEVVSALQMLEIPSGEDKNLREQRIAREKALASLLPKKDVARPVPMEKPVRVLVNCPNTRVTLSELSGLGYICAESNELENFIMLENITKFASLYAARTFYEAGVYFSSFTSLQAAVNGTKSKILLALLKNIYGTLNLSYRIDMIGDAFSDKDRKNATAQVMDALSATPLTNNPSAYDFELRFLMGKRGIVVLIYPGSKLDGRFYYRKNAISASIHPAVAASCMHFISNYIRPSADVLDCFCGSGTMLFERSMMPYASLTGTDISDEALRAARGNERLAKTGAHFLIKNATKPFEQKYDEILTNMPFGLRVSSHNENLSLYRAFLTNLPGMLKPGGYAFLFTHEKKLLKELLSENFSLISQASFSAGGLHPTMFVLQAKN